MVQEGLQLSAIKSIDLLAVLTGDPSLPLFIEQRLQLLPPEPPQQIRDLLPAAGAVKA
jgi:hypothetical protein